MKGFVPRIVRTGVLAIALGVAAAPGITAAAPAQASTIAAPMTTTCYITGYGPGGVGAACFGSGAATLTVYCTNGVSWGLVFAPSNITVLCPPGGTMIRFTLA